MRSRKRSEGSARWRKDNAERAAKAQRYSIGLSICIHAALMGMTFCGRQTFLGDRHKKAICDRNEGESRVVGTGHAGASVELSWQAGEKHTLREFTAADTHKESAVTRLYGRKLCARPGLQAQARPSGPPVRPGGASLMDACKPFRGLGSIF